MAPKAAQKADRKAAKAENALKPKVKRAPSPYIIFSSEKRPGIKISHPDASFGETGRILGKMWAELGEKEKAVSLFALQSISSIYCFLPIFQIQLCSSGLCEGVRGQKGRPREVKRLFRDHKFSLC